MRQLIIVRKDLQMSPGKLAAQVAHASWAFLSSQLRECNPETDKNLSDFYNIPLIIQKDIFDGWFKGIFTKTICEARNKNHLLKATELAEELGLVENNGFFLIRDNCLTELEPEDENGRTLTCIGFIPLEDELAWKISKKYQLYR